MGISARSALVAALAVVAFGAWPAMAQSAAPPPVTPNPAAPTVAVPPPQAPAAPNPAAKKSVAKPRECTRLPLSDIQVGRDKTIEVARFRLDEYIAKEAKKRGWKSWDKSLETVSCEDYLYLPLIGQEYKCFVTATFCKKG